MKLIFRIVSLLTIAAALLAGAGLAAWEITGNHWWVLGAILVVALMLSKLVDEVLGVGIFFGRRQVEREAEEQQEELDTDGREMPPGMKQAISGALAKYGLKPVSMHRVGPGDEDDDDDEDIVERMQAIADEITDPDMKEFAFHFAHIATDCPGSAAHAARMHELVAFIDARLRASTVAPQNDSDRPQVH
jgi:hypothetical protein